MTTQGETTPDCRTPNTAAESAAAAGTALTYSHRVRGALVLHQAIGFDPSPPWKNRGR
jgi:hypothetical protein